MNRPIDIKRGRNKRIGKIEITGKFGVNELKRLEQSASIRGYSFE
jgi:hypothetical protein